MKKKKGSGTSVSPAHQNKSRSRSPQLKKQNGCKSYQNSRKFYPDSDSEPEQNNKKDSEFSWDRKISRKSRSKSRDNDRYHWDKDHRRRSRSGSRWERKVEEHKSRNRDKFRKDDDVDSLDSERSPIRAIIGASGSEIIGYKSQPPNNTIMIRGLASHITENEVRQDIIQCGLMPKDIRLIRKKDTGASRGFAFVEFTTLAEAVRWMDMKQGVLMLQDSYRAIMQYSIPKELCPGLEKPPSYKASADWFCIKCGAQNFKRRDNCFKCHASRMESEEGGSGSDEICSYVTKTIMLRNLDALTTEDSVIQVFTIVIPEIAKKISGVCIGRDPLTSTSRGICYLGTESTIDALALYSSLISLSPPLMIDGKTVIISYCKYNMGDTKRAHETALNAAFPNASQPSMYSLSDVDSLAEYSAVRYSKNVSDYQVHFTYYKEYFTEQITAGNSITLQQDNQMDSANVAAAVAQSAIQQMQASKLFYETTHVAVPTGTDGKRYSIPDISKFVYDKTSGYHYDATTGLYYDPNSSYYWNSVTQKYLYFDHDKLTYALAPVSSIEYDNSQQLAGINAPPGSKKNKVEKQDKVKVAKKIVKDMERWAKTLNQKKDNTTPRFNFDGLGSIHIGGSADIGYSVLEKKNGTAGVVVQSSVDFKQDPASPNSTPLVAAYGESESSDDESLSTNNFDFLDFQKLICNLCKRQLTTADALAKHAQLSYLHKKNMEAFKSGLKPKPVEPTVPKVVYRDRAKERRMKYGDTDEPAPSKLKEKYLQSRELADAPIVASVTEPISSENVGNRLLQKMGWTEGQGLGKTNQGRTTIIQAEQRTSTIGLGNKIAYTAQAGESYKDCVKKMMYARYLELSEKS